MPIRPNKVAFVVLFLLIALFAAKGVSDPEGFKNDVKEFQTVGKEECPRCGELALLHECSSSDAKICERCIQQTGTKAEVDALAYSKLIVAVIVVVVLFIIFFDRVRE